MTTLTITLSIDLDDIDECELTPIDVPCPFCDAKPGSECQTTYEVSFIGRMTGGGRRAPFHSDRLRLMRQADSILATVFHPGRR